MNNLRKNTVTRLLGMLAVLILVACAGTPESKYHENTVKFGEFGEGTRILITNLPLISVFSGVDQDEVSLGRVGVRYRASIYDVTSETRYLGSISYLGDHQRTEWIENKVSPGKHRLMLIAEKSDSDVGGEPYYMSDMSDVIEVDVARAETAYVVLSEREYGGQPYFHHLMVARQHVAYCENLPEKHYSRRSGTIRSYMETSNIEDNATDFFNFCKSLSEQKLMVTTAASVMPLIRANAATIEFSREVALRQLAVRPVKEQRITIGSLQ